MCSLLPGRRRRRRRRPCVLLLLKFFLSENLVADDSSAGNFGIPIIQSTLILHVRINRASSRTSTHFSIDGLSSHQQKSYFFTLFQLRFGVRGLLQFALCHFWPHFSSPKEWNLLFVVSLLVRLIFVQFSLFSLLYFSICTCEAKKISCGAYI